MARFGALATPTSYPIPPLPGV